MRTSLQQSAMMKQDMRMNPRLYQAMDLLYMPLLDLQQHLKQELLTNPFLEMSEPDEEETPAQAEAPEERREEAEKENEFDWEEILLDGFQVGGARQGYEEREFVERMPADVKDLSDYLRDQLRLLDLTPRQRLLAEEFIGNIGEDGYLHATLEEIVAGINAMIEGRIAAKRSEDETAEDEDGLEDDEDEGDEEPARPMRQVGQTGDAALTPIEDHVRAQAAAVVAVADSPAPAAPAATPAPPGAPAPFTLAEAEETLAIMQRLDPAGIAARDLRECLLLQLSENGDGASLTYRLVQESFDDLIAHRWSDLAKRYTLEPKQVQDAADLLSRLDPKPGLRFTATDDGYVTPDIIVEKIEGQYKVFLNDGGSPRLRISRVYQELAGDKKQFQGENREFITEKLNSATWLIQAIEQRRQTMLKVMNFIVDRQREFFDKGVEFLKPLTLREVADVIDMHESTVSRVTSQKYAQTPRGVLPLKFFFSSSLGTTTGEDASARAVKAQIQKLVGDENASRPLTDSEIVDALRARGIRIARRTVAKYRDQLKILPARMRKRV